MKHFQLLLLLLVAFLLLPLPSRADYTTTINPSTNWGMWQGWGCSLAWWANVFGQRDDLADLFFTTKTTTLNGQALPGLGMTVARYNVGGSSNVPINGVSMQPSSHIPPSRQIQSYWLNGASTDPNSKSWDWSVDANQRTMLQKARDRGANLFELFSNSPPWWMCYNHNPSGADQGANDNLQSSSLQQHAIYMATVARYAADHWGIKFDSIDPFNEPISSWWYSQASQEGCHFDVATQTAVINYLRTEMNKRKLTATKISASDENSYDLALSTWNNLGSAQANVGRINVHGYEQGKGQRGPLYKASLEASKGLWNSEYGENNASGMALADNLNLDMRLLHPTAWCYWQPLDGGGWGLLNANLADKRIGAASPKYFVLAQYSRHIRPGMTLIDSGEGSTIAAYHAATHTLVLVTVNHGTGQRISYDLSRFGTVRGPITRWATDTSATGDKHMVHTDISLTGKKFSASFGPNTVQTFEIKNVQ